MLLELKRKPTVNATTFGELLVDGKPFCITLEDQIREVPGAPVATWKVYGQTAIPAGRYRLTQFDSSHFGPRTILVNDVPGFTGILIHGGVDKESTLGCIIVGDRCDEATCTISGGVERGVKRRLNDLVHAAIESGDRVWLEVHNPPGRGGGA